MSREKLFDKVGGALVRKAAEGAEKMLKNLDEFDKQILGICNTPRTDSHIKQMFRSRDAEDRTINIDHKLQVLLKAGILDHAYTKYVVNPKYREFITVMPMTASTKTADGDLEEEYTKLYEMGEPLTEEDIQQQDEDEFVGEQPTEQPADLLSQLHNITYEYMKHIQDPKDVALRVIDYFAEKGLLEKMKPKGENTIADAIVNWVENARAAEEEIGSLSKMSVVLTEEKEATVSKSSMIVNVNFIKPEGGDDMPGDEPSMAGFDTDSGDDMEKESTDIGLGMGIVDQTERQEERDSLIEPKISFKIEGFEKKKSNDSEKLSNREQKVVARRTANKEAMAHLSGYQSVSNVNPQNIHYKAVSFTRSFLANYSFPLYPEIKFNSVKNASQDGDTISGDVFLSLEIRTMSGVKKRAEIILPIKDNEFLEPSTFSVDGKSFVIAQSSIDDIISSGTFYEKVPTKACPYGGPVEERLYNTLKDKKIPKVNIGLFSI